jgi:histidine triad (HIT) family protein
VIIIRDINPQAPTHLLAIPRKHFPAIHDVGSLNAELFKKLFLAIGTFVKQLHLDEAGYRLVINSGEAAGQSVRHIHVHILSGRAMRWPPG